MIYFTVRPNWENIKETYREGNSQFCIFHLLKCVKWIKYVKYVKLQINEKYREMKISLAPTYSNLSFLTQIIRSNLPDIFTCNYYLNDLKMLTYILPHLYTLYQECKVYHYLSGAMNHNPFLNYEGISTSKFT